jgi:hypothetical protein
VRNVRVRLKTPVHKKKRVENTSTAALYRDRAVRVCVCVLVCVTIRKNEKAID